MICNVPIVLFIFNRPKHTTQTLKQIALVKPRKLYVVADGPRIGNDDDVIRCAATRNVIETIDWECDVVKNYVDTNMGCRARMVSGFNWVFEQEEEAIFVEDDCVLNPTFFQYASELLVKYRENPNVMAICALAPPQSDKMLRALKKDSYGFSKHFSAWGWATWRRAWDSFDANISEWGDLRNTDWLYKQFAPNRRQADFLAQVFDKVYFGEIKQSWDYQFLFASLVNKGLTIYPRRNLVTNIGFGADATHTKHTSHPNLEREQFALTFPLKHPKRVQTNHRLDELWVDRTDYSLRGRIRRRIRALWE